MKAAMSKAVLVVFFLHSSQSKDMNFESQWSKLSFIVLETRSLLPRKLMCPPVQWVKARAPVRASNPKRYWALALTHCNGDTYVSSDKAYLISPIIWLQQTGQKLHKMTSWSHLRRGIAWIVKRRINSLKHKEENIKCCLRLRSHDAGTF